jgi:hypothetical protein
VSPNIRAATFARTTVTKCFGLFISNTVRSFFCAADSTVSIRRIAGSAPEEFTTKRWARLMARRPLVFGRPSIHSAESYCLVGDAAGKAMIGIIVWK